MYLVCVCLCVIVVCVCVSVCDLINLIELIVLGILKEPAVQRSDAIG